MFALDLHSSAFMLLLVSDRDELGWKCFSYYEILMNQWQFNSRCKACAD